MKKLENIVVEKDDAGKITWDHPTVPVTLNFDPKKQIGVATLRKSEGMILADIELNTIPLVLQVWPAIGGRIEEKEGSVIHKMKLTCVAFCANPNVDPSIPPIKID